VADDLDPREAERIRRRDHDLEAERRALMNPGMGKVFKQIQDAMGKAAKDLVCPSQRGARLTPPPGSPTRSSRPAASRRPNNPSDVRTRRRRRCRRPPWR
jgi:hypothetical protein